MSLVIIDDSDPSVHYNTSGGWLETGDVPQFNGTAHASGTQGDTATLVFEGTLISVYGTVAPSSRESRLNFSVDGTDVGFYQAHSTATLNNQLFWTSPSLEDVSHKLVITVDQDTPLSQQVNPLNRTLFLDYFIYKTTSTAGKTVVIDDNDPSVTYSPKWNPDHSDSRLENTRHVSNTQLDGAWAAVSFNGTGISLFGSPGPDQGFKASVAIDGSQSGIISQSQNQNSLFDSGALPAGPHTINVTVLGGHQLNIDYFLVKNDLESPSVAPTTSGSGSASTSNPGSASEGTSGTAQGSKTPSIAAIVGGAIGGLVILALILILALIRRRRARTRRNHAAIISVLPRWIGNNEEQTTIPRPFQPSLHEETELPPPYRLKVSPVVGQ
ncbi:hypothetical protein DFH08DRAFT_274640 [Mycena albidolilacea]|uniref:Uncharacterized protein n=1 Tax=Mycena albidolilacea TaxID=1033008 RepID=A0AAD7APF8_9AGAR|nr:hypothetical protein DFH08DRAFT_274640 [Mycena albidolilacea]